MSDVSARLADKLSKKLARSNTQYRSDFALADFEVLDRDKKTARVLIQYDSRCGQPSKEVIAESVLNLYKSADGRPRLLMDLNSVQWFPRHEAVACVVRVPVIRRPFEDIKRFELKAVVGGTMYLGENMNDTWAVAKSGKDVYIERVEEDDIDAILRERSKAKSFQSHASATVTLSRVAASVPECLYSLGDKVKCVVEGKIRKGEILGLAGGGAQVGLSDGSQVLVQTDKIIGLIQAAQEGESFQVSKLKDYYRKAYGYGEAELNKLVQYVK